LKNTTNDLVGVPFRLILFREKIKVADVSNIPVLRKQATDARNIVLSEERLEMLVKVLGNGQLAQKARTVTLHIKLGFSPFCATIDPSRLTFYP
jgi:hypothetical protein